LIKKKEKCITFDEFYDAFKIRDVKASSWQFDVINQLFDSIKNNKAQILTLFRLFDTNDDCKLDETEFRNALQSYHTINGHPISLEQVIVMFKTFDKDDDGMIDYNEFFSQFKVVVHSNPNKEEEDKE